MASKNISQLHRIVFRSKTSSGWDVFTLEPDDLGQDTQFTFNIAPRKKSRSSSMGTSETPIPNTFDSLSASVTFIADTWHILGKALRKWTASTYQGATANDGQILGDSADVCAGGDYMSVIAQGLCDDGSTVDIEFTRCIPSSDDDIEVGTSDATEITLNLNPMVYNETTHEGDGYPEYTFRLGDYDTTTKYRLNATTGVYEAVNE